MPARASAGAFVEGDGDREGHDAGRAVAGHRRDGRDRALDLGLERVDADRGLLAELDAGEVALDDVGRDLVRRGGDDDGRARRSVEAGPDVDLGHDAGDRGLERGCLDLLLDRPARLERLGVLVLGAVQRELRLAFRVGVVGVLGVLECFLGDLDVDVRGADIGRRPPEVGLEVGGVGGRERVALRDGVADLRGHLGHRPRGLAGRGRIVVTDEVRVGAEEQAVRL